MVGRIVAFLYLVILAVLFMLGYNETFIPTWYIPFLIAILGYGIYFAAGYLFNEYRQRGTSNFIMWLSALSIPYAFSSMMYDTWPSSFWFDAIFMFRISLIIIGLLTTYAVIMYIRAQISYKRKRGNQRIYEEPSKEHKKRWKEREKAGKKDEEISITLGRSTESEDKTPPV